MVYCPYNDDSGMHNAYMTKNRIEMREDAGKVEELSQQMFAWGYHFEKKLAAAKAGISQGDPAAMTFWMEWHQLKQDFDSYMGEVSDSNRAELQALVNEKEQFDQRLAQLPAIKMPHYPKPKRVPQEAPDQPPQPAQPSEFVARGAHRESVAPPAPTRPYPEVPP